MIFDILLSSAYIAIDTETTGLNARKDKIVGISVANLQKQSAYLPLYYWNGERLVSLGTEEQAIEVLNICLTKKLIAHNFSFDRRIILSNFGIDLLPALHCDTVILKHTVDERPPFRLKDIAELIDVPGAKVEEEALRLNVLSKGGKWTKDEKEMYKGDLPILSAYGQRDTELTADVYLHYSRKLAELGLDDFFYNQEVMPLYRHVTIPMEEHGIHVDIRKVEQLAGEIEIDIAALENEIQRMLYDQAADLKQRLLNEHAPIVNKGRFAQHVAKTHTLPFPKTASGKYSITKSTIELIKDQTELYEFFKNNVPLSDFSELQLELYKIVTEQRYIINLNSKDQMREVFIKEMKCKALARTPTGKDKIDDEFLESLHDNPLAQKMLVFNKLNKINRTYYQAFLDDSEDGIWYPRFDQHGTISGRYGSDAQQMPRPLPNSENPLFVKYSNAIRHLILPRPDHQLIIADQSALEVRVFSHVSKEPKLIEAFHNGEDFYSKLAISSLGLIEYSAKESDTNFLKKMCPEIRNKIKPVALAIAYGASAWEIARIMNTSIDDAEKFIEKYWMELPELERTVKAKKYEAVAKGRVRQEFGRIRNLPKAQYFYAHYGDNLLDLEYLRGKYGKDRATHEAMKALRRQYKKELNNAFNFCIQSAAASIINRSGIEIAKTIKELNLKTKIILQVHDEFVFDSPINEVERMVTIIKHHMENTIKLLVPLQTSPTVVDNYGQGHA